MKRILKLTLAVAAMLCTSNLYAQKFARINLQEVIVAMPESTEMQTNLEAFGKDLQEQLEQIQVEFNNKYAEFQKNQATMAESVKQMKQQELVQLQSRYEEFQRISQEDYQNKYNELFEPIVTKATDALKKVAKAGGYLAVFSTQNLPYYDEASLVDLAPAVKAELGIK